MPVSKNSQDSGDEDRVPEHGGDTPCRHDIVPMDEDKDQLDGEDEQEGHRHHAKNDEDSVQDTVTPTLGPVYLREEEGKGHCRGQKGQAHDARFPQIIVQALENQGGQKDYGQPVSDDDEYLLHSITNLRNPPEKQAAETAKKPCFRI